MHRAGLSGPKEFFNPEPLNREPLNLCSYELFYNLSVFVPLWLNHGN